MTNSSITQEISTIANILNAHKELAVNSVDFLLTALKYNDKHGIEMALRSLGIDKHDAINTNVSELTSCLHSVVDKFKSSILDNSNEGLSGATGKLKQIVQMNFEAADRTLKECESQSRLYKQQKEYLELIEKQLLENNTNHSAEVKDALDRAKQQLSIMQEQNHKVMMAQSFPDISSKAVKKVIELIESIEQQIFSLTLACTEEEELVDMVRAMKSRKK